MTAIGFTQNLPSQGDTEKLKLQGDTEKLELQGYTEKLIEPALWWSRLRNIVATVVFGCIIALVVLQLVPVSKHQHSSGQAYTVVKTLQGTCPVGWITSVTGCYKFVDSIDWNHGAINCKKAGGFLAEINNQEEQDSVWQIYQQSGLSVDAVWLGATDLAHEGGTCLWYHSGRQMDYTAWFHQTSQPIGAWRNYREEHCLNAFKPNTRMFRWNDAPCNYQYEKSKALCEAKWTEITQGPLTQAVKAGGIVAFYCFATGDPSPNFTWKKNRKKLGYTDSRYLISYSEGGSLLRIEPVWRRDAGSYKCEAENRVSDPVSVEATLEVFDDKELPKGFPQIIQNPGMKVVQKGRNAILVCEASGEPRPTMTWVKDTMPINIQANSRLNLLKIGSLQIMEVEETDQGKYECVASNSVGTVYSYPAQLYVRVRRVPPHFRITPEPKIDQAEVKSGDDLNITCVAVGKPMPFVKWKEGHKDLTDENKAPFGKNVLELTDIRFTSNYTCMAASKLGIIETHTIVKVQG